MANQILTISIFRVMCPLERRTPKILLGVYIPKFHRCREILIRTCIIIDFFHDTDELAIKSKNSSVGALYHGFCQWRDLDTR